jgi:[ribosomal protein S5]-alanine N-acetyltransferase
MVHLENIRAIPVKELQILANNKVVAGNLKDGFPHPYTLTNAKDFIRLSRKGLLGHGFGIFNDDTFIGVGNILPQRDIYRNNGEIGYWIGQPYWGNGYGKRAVELLTAYAFEKLNLIRVFAGVFANNKASMKVLENSGYKLEVILKSSIVKHGIILDEYLYSKLNVNNEQYLNQVLNTQDLT